MIVVERVSYLILLTSLLVASPIEFPVSPAIFKPYKNK